MKVLLLLLFLLLTTASYAQTSSLGDEKSPVVVVSAKWLRDRQSVDKVVQSASAPAAALTSADKNYERQKRSNALPGDRDPLLDNVDSRASDLERIVQESRQPVPVDGYTYQVKIHNVGAKLIQKIFWDYEFTEIANSNLTRRRFMCGGEIKPDRQKEFQIFSLSGPSEVVNVKTLAANAGKEFRGAVIVNRVEYSDGTFWERNGWSLDALKLRPDSRSKSAPTVCRSL